MILIHKLVLFKVDKDIRDTGGMYLVFQGTPINEKMNMNDDNPKF